MLSQLYLPSITDSTDVQRRHITDMAILVTSGARLYSEPLCPMLFDPVDSKPDIRRSGKEIVQRLIDNVKAQLQLHPIRIFVLALIAGGLICYGAAIGGLSSAGAQHFMISFGFLAGFTVVNLSGAALNSVTNVEYSMFLLHGLNGEYNRQTFERLGLFWAIINVGNVLGSLGTASMIIFVNSFDDGDKERLNDILIDKLKDTNDGFPGIVVVFVSAMLANWIVGHCVVNAASSRTSEGKAVGIFYCVFMFAVLGLQHGAASNGQIFLGLVSGLDAVSWGRAFWGNIVPSIFGNALGAMVFVGCPFWYALYFTKWPENSWRKKMENKLATPLQDNSGFNV